MVEPGHVGPKCVEYISREAPLDRCGAASHATGHRLRAVRWLFLPGFLTAPTLPRQNVAVLGIRSYRDHWTRHRLLAVPPDPDTKTGTAFAAAAVRS